MYNAYKRHKCTLWFYPSPISKTVFSLSLSPSLPISVSPSLSSLNIYANTLKPEKLQKSEPLLIPSILKEGGSTYTVKENPQRSRAGSGSRAYAKAATHSKVYGKKQKPKQLRRDTTAIPSVKTCRSDKGCPLPLCKDSLTVCAGFARPHRPHVKRKVLLGLVQGKLSSSSQDVETRGRGLVFPCAMLVEDMVGTWRGNPWQPCQS